MEWCERNVIRINTDAYQRATVQEPLNLLKRGGQDLDVRLVRQDLTSRSYTPPKCGPE